MDSWSSIASQSRNGTTGDDFIEPIDLGLLFYKEQLYQIAVTSMETLKHLRTHEVRSMDIPLVYQRLLISKIIHMQTPETKRKMILREEDDSPSFRSTQSTVSDSSNGNARKPKRQRLTFENEDDPNTSAERSGKSYIESEMEKLMDERESLSILLVHKQNALKDLRKIPEPLAPVALPGCAIQRTVCDRCHHRGHKATGNRGNKSCILDPCDGYQNCGLMTKHKDYKQAISEAKREISSLEKDVKINQDKIQNMKTFLETNTTNFVKVVRPHLQLMFPGRYVGKDGNQALQKDVRFIKIASAGKIPSNLSTMTKDDFTWLIDKGKKTVGKTFIVGEQEHVEKPQQPTIIPPMTCTPSVNFQQTATTSPMFPLGVQTWPSYQTPYWNYNPTHAAAMSPTYGMYPWQLQSPQWYTPPPVSPASCTVSTAPSDDIFPPLPTTGPVPSPRPPSPSEDFCYVAEL